MSSSVSRLATASVISGLLASGPTALTHESVLSSVRWAHTPTVLARIDRHVSTARTITKIRRQRAPTLRGPRPPVRAARSAPPRCSVLVAHSVITVRMPRPARRSSTASLISASGRRAVTRPSRSSRPACQRLIRRGMSRRRVDPAEQAAQQLLLGEGEERRGLDHELLGDARDADHHRGAAHAGGGQAVLHERDLADGIEGEVDADPGDLQAAGDGIIGGGVERVRGAEARAPPRAARRPGPRR